MYERECAARRRRENEYLRIQYAARLGVYPQVFTQELTILLREIAIGKANEMSHEGTEEKEENAVSLPSACTATLHRRRRRETRDVWRIRSSCVPHKAIPLPDDQSIGMIPLFLCVDCGGTNAAAVIADANANILGRGLAFAKGRRSGVTCRGQHKLHCFYSR